MGLTDDLARGEGLAEVLGPVGVGVAGVGDGDGGPGVRRVDRCDGPGCGAIISGGQGGVEIERAEGAGVVEKPVSQDAANPAGDGSRGEPRPVLTLFGQVGRVDAVLATESI